MDTTTVPSFDDGLLVTTGESLFTLIVCVIVLTTWVTWLAARWWAARRYAVVLAALVAEARAELDKAAPFISWADAFDVGTYEEVRR